MDGGQVMQIYNNEIDFKSFVNYYFEVITYELKLNSLHIYFT